MEEKREPLSEMAIERKIQILRNKHMDSEVIALVKSDYEYGLTDDEIGLYLNKSYDIEQMKVLSKCLHKGVSEELLTLLKDSRMAAPKMQTALDYYEKGVPIDAIREVVQKDDTAVNMRRMFDVVLDKLNKAKEQMPQDLEYVKSLVAQMDEVVAKINHQNERYDALNKKLSEIETSKDDEEVRERLVKENQDKDALINSQQNELNKASSTIARLRDDIEKKDKEMKRMGDRIESLEDKIISVATENKNEAESKAEPQESQSVSQADKKMVDTVAVPQNMQAVANGIPVYYQIPVVDGTGNVVQRLPIERSVRKSSSDKSYNFIIGLLYTQIFQELYYQADFNCGGRLPIHVTFMLDEFANVALPDDFCSLLSTMRSREISSIIIIQNFAQLKALFKDTWETIPGNCDTFIYLGGNEQSTHKYVSELLGKGTIDKKSSGETKGRQGSSSRNYDVLGRELFTPDEVRKLDNKKCIIFIRGFDPIMDNKFIPFNHPMFNQTADGKGEPYVHQIRGADNLIGPPFEILSDKAVKYYEKLRDKGENVYIDSLTYEQFMMLGDAELSRRFSMQDEAEQKAKIDREQANELEYVDESQKSEATESANASSGSAGAKPVRNPEREKPKWEDTITNRMLHWSYTPEQKEELKMALAAGVPKATILTYFYPEVTAEKMSSYRMKQ